MLTAAVSVAARQVTADNWPEYLGCVAVVVFLGWGVWEVIKR